MQGSRSFKGNDHSEARREVEKLVISKPGNQTSSYL